MDFSSALAKAFGALWFMLGQTAILIGPAALLVALWSWWQWPKRAADRKRLWPLLWLLAPPLFIAAWAGVFWADGYHPNPNGGAPDLHGLDLGLGLPLLLEFVLPILFVVRMKGLRGWPIVYGLFGAFTTLLFAFLGIMAMTGSWI